MLFGRQPRQRARSDGQLFSGTPGLSGVRWRLMLVWLLRLMAVLWLLKGLNAWATILGVQQATDVFFEQRSLMFQATTIFFAVIDLVAAVGLWLTAAWGGVVWLIAAGSQLVLGYFFPRVMAFDNVTAGIYAVMAIAYFAFTWAAAHDES
jgi:hypothetical protein